MAKTALDSIDDSPGWSHYISAVDFIVDASPDDYESLAMRSAQSIKKLKSQRARLLEQASTIVTHAEHYGLTDIRFTAEDPVGEASYDIDKMCRGAAELLADSTSTVEQVIKFLPSQKKDRSLDVRLDSLDELAEWFERGLSVLFSELPELLNDCEQQLTKSGRISDATNFTNATQRIVTHQQKLSMRDPGSASISFASLIDALREDQLQEFRSAVLSAQRECSRLGKDEERLRMERAAEDERRRAEAARLAEERIKLQEAQEAERKTIVGLLQVANYAVPLSLLCGVFVLMFLMRGWSAFAVSLCTGFLVLVGGTIAVVLARKKIQPASALPKFLLAEKEVVFVGALTAALSVPVLQFLAGMIAGIVGFAFSLTLHPLVKLMFPCGSWASFFGFIVLGPLAALGGAFLVLAIYYISLRKPLSQREAFLAKP